MNTEAEKRFLDQISPATLKVGDLVTIGVDMKTFYHNQIYHGGYIIDMSENVHKVGMIYECTRRGSVRVIYGSKDYIWEMNPKSLKKVTCQVGDCVAIRCESLCHVLQAGHGGWVQDMKEAVGKAAYVLKVYENEDIRVQEIASGKCWTLNPKAIYFIHFGSSIWPSDVTLDKIIYPKNYAEVYANRIQNVDSDASPPECIVCCSAKHRLIRFNCGHEIACSGCSARMKKCMSCGCPITNRVNRRGEVELRFDQETAKKVMINCPICKKKPFNIVFHCGHICCKRCLLKLRSCQVCKKMKKNKDK